MNEFLTSLWYSITFFVKSVIAYIPQIKMNPPSTNEPNPIDDVALWIKTYNNDRVFIDGTITIPKEGIVIHQIDQTVSNAIATEIEKVVPAAELCYYMGCLALESVFDPNCQNGNLGPPPRSNPTNDPMKYDWGIPQLKLEYITAPGVVDRASALSFALDITRAIPYFYGEMQSKLAWADQVLAQYPSMASNPILKNRYLLATGAYNFGEEGMFTDYYSKDIVPSHCQQVLDLSRYFSGKLNKQDIFSTLS